MGSVQMQRICEREDARIVALVEPNRERGLEALNTLGLSADLLTDDFDQMVSRDDIDAVWLVSPNSFHGPQSIRALQAGKHVFCEKPVATSFSDFCRQIEVAGENPNLKTFVDYTMLFDQMEQRLERMVRAGEFGRVTQIQVNYRHPVNIAGDKTWKLRRSIMGDAIGMGIIHSLSAMVFLMQSQTKPTSVYARALGTQVRGFEAPPIYTIMVGFADGTTGVCFGNIDNGNGYDAYHNIYGTAGGFVFDSQNDDLEKVKYWSAATNTTWIRPLDPARCATDGFPDLAWPTDVSTPDSGDVVEHQTGAVVDHFISCIQNDEQSFLSFANSQSYAELGWATLVSAKLGSPVELPLDWELAKEFATLPDVKTGEVEQSEHYLSAGRPPGYEP